MQQHIDFPVEISVLKFQAWPIWWKTRFLRLIFLNDQRIVLVVTCLRLQFRSVGSGWQWISEGLNCVKFLFKFVTWKIGPLSHLNDIFLSSVYNIHGDHWPETTSNYLVNRCISLINWVSLCPFYQQLYSPVTKNQKYAKIPSNYRKTQQKHQVEIFIKKYCSFFNPHMEKF